MHNGRKVVMVVPSGLVAHPEVELKSKFLALESVILSGQLISESQLVRYARGISERSAEHLSQLPEEEQKPYTVLWFDCKLKTSHMRHTHAKDSIEAISNVQSEIPLSANVSSYPTHFPSSLRFVPDSMVKSGQVPNV